ncbi:MAG: hydrogenase iron-sulfur subunit [bacterium]
MRLVHIPCLKKIDILWLLSLFSSGIDGIFVIACDECRDLAKGRVEYAKRLLKEIGLEEERLQLYEPKEIGNIMDRIKAIPKNRMGLALMEQMKSEIRNPKS